MITLDEDGLVVFERDLKHKLIELGEDRRKLAALRDRVDKMVSEEGYSIKRSPDGIRLECGTRVKFIRGGGINDDHGGS